MTAACCFPGFAGLTGGTAVDTVVLDSDNQATWEISSMGSGTVRVVDVIYSFAAMEDITGGAGDNAFTFTDTGNISGTVTGGAGTDTMDFSRIDNGISLDVTLDSVSGNGFTGTARVGSVVSVFSGIDSMAGNTGSLRGLDATATWTVAGNNSSYSDTGSGRSLSFSGFARLDGGTAVDTIVHGAGDTVATWTITAADAGTVMTGSASSSFSGMENISGGSAADIFQFDSGGSISGNIDGGAGDDAIDMNNINSGTSLAVILGAVSAVDGFSGNINAGTTTTAFSNINTVRGSSSTTDSLRGLDADATWTVAEANSSYSDISSGRGLAFADFAEIAGGTAVDTIAHGAEIISAWNITGAGSGEVLTASLRQGFSTMDNILGNKGADTFAFAAGGSVSGFVDGDTGNDSLDFSGLGSSVNLEVVIAGTPVAAGFAGNMSAGTLAATFSNINMINAGTGTGDSITGLAAENVWNIAAASSYTTATASGTTMELAFSGFENITGGSGKDTFNFATGATMSGVVAGGGGADTIDFNGTSAALAVNLTGGVADGYSGSMSSGMVDGSFTGIDVIAASTGSADNLQGVDQDGTWELGATNMYRPDLAGSTLEFSGFENFSGGGATDSVSLNTMDDASWTIDGAGSGMLTMSTMSYSFAGMDNLGGGSGADSFNFAGGSISGDVNGNLGADSFMFSGGSAGGTVIGGAGTDTLDFSAMTTASATMLTDVAGTGFSGSMDSGSVAVSFSGIDTVHGGTGTMDSMQGLSMDSTYTLGSGTVGGVPQLTDSYSSNGQQLSLFNVELYSGSASSDTFVIGRDYNGDINSMGGEDIFEVAATVNGNIDAGTGDDVLTLLPGGSIAGGLNLGAAAGENDLLDVSAYDMPLTLVFDENGGQAYAAGNDGTSPMTIIAGDNSGANGNGLSRQTGSSVSMYGAERVMGAAHNPQDGTGTYLVVQPAAMPTDKYVVDLTINGPAAEGGVALDLPDLRGFEGHVLIGGVGAPPFLGDGADSSLPIVIPGIDTSAAETSSLIRSRRTVIAGDVAVGGSLALLGSSVVLGGDVYAGVAAEDSEGTSAAGSDGKLAVVATGLAPEDFSGNGQVVTEVATGEKERVVAAGDALFVVGDTLRNAESTVIDLGSGDLQFAQGSDSAVSFSSFSRFVGAEVGTDVDSYISSQLDLSLNSVVLILFNPANAFIQSTTVAVDTGLFQSDINLFGVLGKGVSLMLSLCEELEGCAPPVELETIEKLLQVARQKLAELENARAVYGNEAGGNEATATEALILRLERTVRNMEALRGEYMELFGEGNNNKVPAPVIPVIYQASLWPGVATASHAQNAW